MIHTDKPPLDNALLEHHGVKGMRWGVRGARSSVGGVLRTQATRKTQRMIDLHTKARDNKGLIGKVAQIDKHTWGGKGRFEGYHNHRIAELERSQERIATGHLVAKTLLLGPQYSKAK